MAPIPIHRDTETVRAEPRRVLAKPYLPGEEITPGGDLRAEALLRRVLAIPEDEVPALIAEILGQFADRHRRFEETLERHSALVVHHTRIGQNLSRARRLLIGAYFTHEYSVEGAALFNPSIVLAPDSREDGGGPQRFVMSVRAVGEGHISSIGFRTGSLDGSGKVVFDPPGKLLVSGEKAPPTWYGRRQFQAKLVELGTGNAVASAVLATLQERFTRSDLEASITRLEQSGLPPSIGHETIKTIRLLAASSYITSFPEDSALGERVLFPTGPHETQGMEDARFVRFTDDDGSVRFHATYTAFDGREIIPQMIETADFVTFAVSTLSGSAAQNKGMALFPRRVGGEYLMLSRKDRENLYLARSSDLRLWNDSVPLFRPSSPWELLQIGNCGSPLETDEGWLVLTHGVGPMRRYTLGALLLDRDDPTRVLGHLPVPLMAPSPAEREGYVPNVLYSCGSLIHGPWLIIPYGFSDTGIGIARVPLADLLAELRRPASKPPG